LLGKGLGKVCKLLYFLNHAASLSLQEGVFYYSLMKSEIAVSLWDRVTIQRGYPPSITSASTSN